MQDVMIDLETLGTVPGCAILSIGCVAFDFKTKQLGDTFYIVVDRASCQAVGLKEDSDTLAWWKRQADEAKQVLKDAETGVPLAEALDYLTDYLRQFGLGKVKIWGNGSDFDNAILAACYASVGKKLPWLFWNNRCYRTLKSVFSGPKLVRQGTYHNALDDARSQALHALQLVQQVL